VARHRVALHCPTVRAIVVATDLHDTAPALDGVAGVTYRRLDVTSPDDWGELAAWLQGEHGRADGLVNNAGVPFRARVHEIELTDWHRVLDVNLTGPLLGIQAIAPLMTRGGSIVNISSVAGLTAHYGVAYTSSKWGLRGLSRVASLELGERGIRVNTVFPGFIETPMTATAPEAFRTSNLAATPLGRTGAAEEVAPLIVYLISDESSFVSGAEIVVDGGLSAHGGTKPFSDAVRAAASKPTERGAE
jgi:3alpha(or 20beta)-hydroxysteroid dehydrogenase